MKPTLISPLSLFRAHRKHGMALVIVVSMLGLLTMLLLASFSLTETDFTSEISVHEHSRAQMLADDAVALAQASLAGATSQQFADGTPKPWTSQPGAIRVHEMDGSLEAIHKLYSAREMTASSVAEVNADLPDNWAQQVESFVDLNEPQTLGNGELLFPIVDPRAMSNDPLTNVEGFTYEASKDAVTPHGDSSRQRLPMPVRWMYMLQDGTLGTVDEHGRFLSSTPGVEPSRDNPIVGRFAWWVDDETCKVNVNTAGEGSFWDVPVADTAQERSLAKRQPSRLEYYRQPGHPAGVSLSSVLLPGRRQYPYGFVSDKEATAPAGDPLGGALVAMSAEDARDLWRLGRQIMTESDQGTSFGGFRETDWTYLWPKPSNSRTRQARYATLDELVYDSTSMLGSVRPTRAPHAFFARHPESIQQLERGRFFLTADSSAPEVTLFGTPRIALWPVHATAMLNEPTTSGTAHTGTDGAIRKDTAYDRKVAETSTLNGTPFFVQRSEPGNGGNDFEVHASGNNKKLFEYLQRLTSRDIPGYARAGADFTNFLEKYGDDRDALLIEMLDYIRSSNFSDGQLAKNNQFSVLCPGVEHQGFGQVSPLQQRVVGTGANGAIHPAVSNHPQGLGRMLTISEVALVVICRAEVVGVKEDGSPRFDPESPNLDDVPAATLEELTKPGDRLLEVGLLVEAFVPEQGWADYRPYATVALFGGAPGAAPNIKDALPAMSINGKTLLKVDTSSRMFTNELPPAQWNGSGGSIGLRSLAANAVTFAPVVVKAEDDGTAPDLEFRGGSSDGNELKMALYDAPDSTDKYDLLQVVPLKLPDIIPSPDAEESARIKVPALPKDLLSYYTDKKYPPYRLKTRVEQSAKSGKPLLSNFDVVQSLTPLHGDYRLTATQRWAESRSSANVLTHAMPTFVPHPAWGRSSRATSLQDPTLGNLVPESLVGPAIGASWGSGGYIPSLSYGYANGQATPDIPPFLASRETGFSLWDGTTWRTATNLHTALSLLRRDGGARGSCWPEVTGDFDNGLGNAPDGPYSNRADDGNWAAALASGKVPYFDNVSQTGSSTPPVSMATFSPQRILPSAVVFGSLPTGTRAQVPWQTLLFRPAPPVSTTEPKHYGSKTPPDHLLLDLFWSPVIEPEPLSLGFETEGKINLNYQMLPFQHIKRATALHALLKAETITAIPDTAASSYKKGTEANLRFRHYIDTQATLKLWEKRVFDRGSVFLTPSEICEQPLVPEGLFTAGAEPSTEAVDEYWKKHRLTGDNSKERPYARLYPRLTTRSNTFRIHFIAQSLKKVRTTDPAVFDSQRDRVMATVRGSRHVRRTLDMDDPNIPDYLSTTATPNEKPLDAFYVWSVGNMEK